MQSEQLKIYTVDILGRKTLRKIDEGGGIVFELLAEANEQLHCVFCFGHHISWYEHVFKLQMYKC